MVCMLDGVSLDQLRTFIAAVDEGSFSAAARKLNRVQSAVSGWVGGLEDQIGRFPKLTPEGVLLLADARNILAHLSSRLTVDGARPSCAAIERIGQPQQLKMTGERPL